MSSVDAFHPDRQDFVDYVIPRMERDIALCIDPFLLYRSQRDEYQKFHKLIVSVFEMAFQGFRDGDVGILDYLIDFPEVDELRFGYSTRSQSGRGLGRKLNQLLGDVLIDSEEVLKRGLKHIEEIQLVSIGVGSDRLSDVVANIIKHYLISYTQEQARIWSIPLRSGVPVSHVFDPERFEWYDGYFDLPVSPIDGQGIILVPRSMVRQLPWINYQDFRRNEFTAFLQPSNPGRRTKRSYPPKGTVVSITRSNLRIVDEYISRKERESDLAKPSLGSLSSDRIQIKEAGQELIERLRETPTGIHSATDYQRLVLEIFNFLFYPDLVDGELEAATYLGTERRDIIFVNESTQSFWDYIRNNYGSIMVPLECKNVKELELDHVNQMAGYMGERLGPFGIIVTRSEVPDNIRIKTYTVHNNDSGSPRKTILLMTDSDLVSMINTVILGGNASKYVQQLYRQFRSALQ